MQAKEYFDSIKNKEVTVIGIGISNTPLIKMLRRFGVSVTACDKRGREQLGDLCAELEEIGVKLSLGADYLENISADIIIKTPGMRPDLPALTAAKESGTVVTSEMEIFFELCPCKIVAVTGSDGKSTTTAIINELLSAAGYVTHLGGNIGCPLLPDIENIGKDDICVIELSSFQLMTMKKSPDIAVVTNLSPNHLDMHISMDEYIGAKKNIFLHQKKGERLVLNHENKITADFCDESVNPPVWFSLKNRVENGFYFDGCSILKAEKNGDKIILSAKDILIPGLHNIDNYMAAIAAVYELVDLETIKEVAKAFGGLKHRIELVRTIHGVTYYNDSIASSPTRAAASFEALSGNVVLIAGGSDKGISFDEFGEAAAKRCKAIVLCGATAEKIEKAIKSAPSYSEKNPVLVREKSFKAAVLEASHLAGCGDKVILSPACASFDMFDNFEQRGNIFKSIVMELK